jgi:flagellar basal-body rod protein FlgC
MHVRQLFPELQIPASGLAAEKLRMEVVANNIASAHTAGSTPETTFRRQHVVFADRQARSTRSTSGTQGLEGVAVVGVVPDQSDLQQVYEPGHPQADPQGFVSYPNVSIPIEMIDLMTASRAYEANLKALQLQTRMAEQSLSLLRG